MEGGGFLDAALLRQLQQDAEQESATREARIPMSLKEVLQSLEGNLRQVAALTSRIHSLHSEELPGLMETVVPAFTLVQGDLARLRELADPLPYYRYNNMWSHSIQAAVAAVLLCYALGFQLPAPGAADATAQPVTAMRLAPIELVASILGVPANTKADELHVTIEEYLHAVISTINELSRLCVNCVTLRDYTRPFAIMQLVKQLHSAFQLLNLKNDSLRRRFDSIKYDVKKTEEVNYDLAIHGLASTNPV